MKKLFPFLKPYRLQLTVGPFFKLSEAVLELLIPTLMALLIDNGVNMGNRSYIIKMGILMLVIATFGVIFAFICQYSASIAFNRDSVQMCVMRCSKKSVHCHSHSLISLVRRHL